MKRKFLILLTSVLALILFAFGISACDKKPANEGEGSDTEQGGSSTPTGPDDPTHTHSFTEYVFNNDATCTEDGTETATCECGETDTRTKEGSKLGHDFTVENKCSRFDTCGGIWEFTPGLAYTDVEDGYAVTGIGEACWDIVIPYGYNGKPVTKILESAFLNCKIISSITIPGSVKTIGKDAFSGCSELKKVNIADLAAWCKIDFANLRSNPLYFSHSLYMNNVKLKDLSIPAGITEIKDYAFTTCSGLTGKLEIPDGVTTIGKWAIRECSGLTGDLKIPESVTTIEDFAFYNCSGLTGKLEIPDSVTSIGRSVFSGCSGLTGLTFGSSLTEVGPSMFKNCSELTREVKIPEGVTKIGDNAFEGCGKIMSLTIPSGVTSIGKSAFADCGKITSVIWNAEDVETDGSEIFSGCTKINTVTFGGKVVTIPSFAFSGCSGINVELKIPEGVTSIGNSAFAGCSQIPSVVWNAENCTSAGANDKPIFSGCTSVKKITFGTTVKTIPAYCFMGCSGLTSITIPDSVTLIGESAFSGCNGLSGDLKIPAGVTSLGANAFVGSKIESITIPTLMNGTTYTYFGYLFGASRYNDNFNFVPTTLKSVTILGGEIGEYAFYECDGVTSITLGEGVTKIGDHAFYECDGITSMIIGEGVTSIGERAFESCGELESVTIGSNVTSIGTFAFWWCRKLTTVEFKNPNGWYVSKEADATSGTDLSGLENATTAANYLLNAETDSGYSEYCWKRK